MSLTRPQMRSALRGALAISADFAGHTVLTSWGRNKDAASLPSIGIFTPRFQIQTAAVGARQETTDLLVLIGRQDGDTLEDLLDADATAMETLVLETLAPDFDEIEILSGENDVPGIGEKRLGTMMLTFRAVALTDRII